MNLTSNNTYTTWLKELKTKVRSLQLKAAVRVNTELINLYWELGAEIEKKQQTAQWGSKLIEQLSNDLTNEFPDMKGFSRRNLMYIQKWYRFYNQKPEIVQQAVALITAIPWGHNIAIIEKTNKVNEALYYASKTAENGWSRSVLVHQIESDLYKREGASITNFKQTLPQTQSDLALQTLKDPYIFDFLTMREKYDERELEESLINHVTKFLLELGAGFSYIGRQYRLEVGGEEYFIDLLFYHVKLHSYIVIELKTGKFKPEYAGQLNFYVTAVDNDIRTKEDKSTIGILICKSKNNTVVEYALQNIEKPIGVSEYTLTKSLPENLKSSLPTVEEIEAELKE